MDKVVEHMKNFFLLDTIYIVFFKNCYKLPELTCSFTVNTVEKKMTM